MSTDSEAVVRDLMDHFRRIVRALRSSQRAADHLDLTGAQLFIIKVLGEAARPMSISELADATETSQSTASVVSGRLVERGLVSSHRSTVDARRAELSLTTRGRALHRKTPVTVAQLKLAEALKDLPLRDAAKLQELLGIIVSKMGIGLEAAGMMFDEEQPEPRRPAGKSAAVRRRAH
jgi:DNA-binding MarR family transcriptional regulator